MSKMVILLLKALLKTAYFLCIRVAGCNFGNEICLVDGTYKKTCYPLPHFFMVVKINVDYEAVSAFLSDGEGTENIVSATKVMKSWNPDWSALYNIVDCCFEEINAIETLFSGS